MAIAKYARLLGGAAAVTWAAGAAAADITEIPLTASSSHPPVVPWVSTIKTLVVPEANKRLEAKGSKYRIDWTEAYAGALYNFQNTLEGIENNLGDIGWVGTLWEPVKAPLHNVTYYAPFATDDVYMLMEIQEELEKLPAFKEEWSKHNIVFLGAQVADSYQLVTKKPIKRLEDVDGLKLTAPGAIAAYTRNTGAIPIESGLPVTYNNLQTGVADGSIIITTGVVPFKLYEVAPYLTKVGFGGCICGALAMNKDRWDDLPGEVKEVFVGIGRDYARAQTKLVAENEAKFFKLIAEKGGTVSEFPPEERKRWAMALPDVAGDWVKANEAKGIPAGTVLTAFMDAVRKRGGHPVRDWDQ